MKKGFKIVCNNCGAEIDAITHDGDNIKVVTLSVYDTYEVEIECECGNK